MAPFSVETRARSAQPPGACMAPSRTVVKSIYIISDLSPDVRNTEDFSLAGGIVSADADDDRHDSVIYDFVYMKVALEAGPRRETIHGRAFSEIVSMKITL